MNKLQLSGAALVIGAAAMFSMSPVFADDTATTTTAPAMKCVDQTSDAKTMMDKDGNAIMTKDACDTAKGNWVEDKGPAAEGTPAPADATQTPPAE